MNDLINRRNENSMKRILNILPTNLQNKKKKTTFSKVFEELDGNYNFFSMEIWKKPNFFDQKMSPKKIIFHQISRHKLSGTTKISFFFIQK